MSVEKNKIHERGQTQHPAYRPDIDGLRAVAVLAIVTFHAFPTWLPGGFVGVDVFFVISGYLISSILFKQMEQGTFSFFEFYGRRIKRIFPALLVVLSTSLVIGWLVLLAEEYAQLGKHVAGGAGFIANFLYWSESGYFDTAAESKPLLHLWSLGVEEQFYILWPLFLYWVWKRKLNTGMIIAAVAAVSFVLNILGISGDSTAMFYSPQSRFWELLTGALLAYSTIFSQTLVSSSPRLSTWKKNNNKKVASELRSIAGVLLIGLALVLTTQGNSFPGWWALLPTVGTALIISAGSGVVINRIILGTPVLVWFGLISYPLYLWHWPLLTFIRIIQSDTPSQGTRAVAVLIAIALAWLTYRFIEKPIRFGSRDKKTIPVTLLFLMLIVGTAGYACYQTDGVVSRKVVSNNPSVASQWDGRDRGVLVAGCGLVDPATRHLFGECSHDSRQPSRFALLGDSKASAIFRGLVRTSSKNGRWLCIGGHGPNGSPVPVLSEATIYKEHQKLTTLAIESLSANEEIKAVALVVASRTLFKLNNDFSIEDLPASPHYAAARDGLVAATDKLVRAGKQVVLLVDNPTLPYPEDCISRRTSSKLLNILLLEEENERCNQDLQRHLELSSQYRQLLDEVAAHDPKNISVFDTIEHLCDTKAGVCTSHKDGRLLYSYTDHISDYAAGLIGKDLNAYLNKLTISED